MQKRSLNLLFLSVFTAVLALNFVSAQTVLQNVIDSFRTSVGGLVGTGPGFAQFLLFILVALIVYAIAEELPFVGKKGWIAGGVAIVISILSTFFLRSEEVYTILISYGALGITLTAILPFIVIAVISKRSHDKGYFFLSKILWIVFAVVTLFRLGLSTASEIGTFGNFVYPIVLILTLIMLFLEGWFYLKLSGIQLKEGLTRSQKLQAFRITAEIEDLQKQLFSAAIPADQKVIIRERIDDLKKEFGNFT